MDSPRDPPPPLFVDLDGTLTPSDLLHETLRAYLGRKPWMLPACALWLARGRALNLRAVKGDHFALGAPFVYDLSAADVILTG